VISLIGVNHRSFGKQQKPGNNVGVGKKQIILPNGS
jgi:hypothetical protein